MDNTTKKRWLLAHLIFLSAFGALATDMYLPALPMMSDEFNCSVGTVNLTLVLFFLFSAISMLIWGTLSDKYGRRPTLLVGVALFILTSFLCALSSNVYQLIVFRVFQAVGSSAAISVSMAVMKDVFEGKERERALAFASILMALGPILAPIIGALLLKISSWRGIFLCLAGLGIIGLMGCVLMQETAKIAREKSIILTLGNLPKLLKNLGFTYPMLLFSLTGFPLMLFLGASSNIYIKGFGLSEQIYSYFFAANAFFASTGPMIFMKINGKVHTYRIITASFAFMLLSGLLIMGMGSINPYLFAIAVLPSTISGNMIRPPSANILLEQGREDAGAASSLMNFFFIFMGSLAMQFISFDWDNRIFVMGATQVFAGIVCLIFWPVVWKRCKISD